MRRAPRTLPEAGRPRRFAGTSLLRLSPSRDCGVQKSERPLIAESVRPTKRTSGSSACRGVRAPDGRGRCPRGSGTTSKFASTCRGFDRFLEGVRNGQDRARGLKAPAGRAACHRREQASGECGGVLRDDERNPAELRHADGRRPRRVDVRVNDVRREAPGGELSPGGDGSPRGRTGRSCPARVTGASARGTSEFLPSAWRPAPRRAARFPGESDRRPPSAERRRRRSGTPPSRARERRSRWALLRRVPRRDEEDLQPAWLAHGLGGHHADASVRHREILRLASPAPKASAGFETRRSSKPFDVRAPKHSPASRLAPDSTSSGHSVSPRRMTLGTERK